MLITHHKMQNICDLVYYLRVANSDTMYLCVCLCILSLLGLNPSLPLPQLLTVWIAQLLHSVQGNV